MSFGHQNPAPATTGAAGVAFRPIRPVALPALRATWLLDQVRERVRGLRYSLRTEEAYLYRCRAFVRFHGLRHPAELGGPEVGQSHDCGAGGSPFGALFRPRRPSIERHDALF